MPHNLRPFVRPAVAAPDAAYATPQRPTLVSYRFRAMYAALMATAEDYNAPEYRMGLHAFLQLPAALELKAGHTYTVAVAAWGNAKAGGPLSFSLPVLPEAQRLNLNIRVNQVGTHSQHMKCVRL